MSRDVRNWTRRWSLLMTTKTSTDGGMHSIRRGHGPTSRDHRQPPAGRALDYALVLSGFAHTQGGLREYSTSTQQRVGPLRYPAA
jgi:hypothetical protein